jgi:hypothetical protein
VLPTVGPPLLPAAGTLCVSVISIPSKWATRIAAESDSLGEPLLPPGVQIFALARESRGSGILHGAVHSSHHLGQIITMRQLMGLWARGGRPMRTEIISRRDDLVIRRLVLEPGEAMPWHTDPCHRFTVVVRATCSASTSVITGRSNSSRWRLAWPSGTDPNPASTGDERGHREVRGGRNLLSRSSWRQSSTRGRVTNHQRTLPPYLLARLTWKTS